MTGKIIKYRGQIYKLAVADMPLQVMLLRPGQEFDGNKFFTPCARISTDEWTNKPVCDAGQPCWTSSLEDQQTDWLRWCKTDMASWIGNKAVIFKAAPTARILHIASKDAYAAAVAKYPHKRTENYTIDRGTSLEYSKILQDYDAVHVCDEGLWQHELSFWDAESTVWFNPGVLELVRVVDVKHECSIPAEQEVEDWERNMATSYKIDANKVRRHSRTPLLRRLSLVSLPPDKI
jgi:hypothetical protein